MLEVGPCSDEYLDAMGEFKNVIPPSIRGMLMCVTEGQTLRFNGNDFSQGGGEWLEFAMTKCVNSTMNNNMCYPPDKI